MSISASHFAPKSPKRLKTAKGCFRCKIALHLTICYEVSLCEYCQQQSCKAFTGLSKYRCKMVCQGRPLLCRSLQEGTDNCMYDVHIFLCRLLRSGIGVARGYTGCTCTPHGGEKN